MVLNEKWYKVFKWLGLICLPALATFVLLLGDTWQIPYYQQIATTITGLGTFIGALIGVSNSNYYKEEYTPTEEEQAE